MPGRSRETKRQPNDKLLISFDLSDLAGSQILWYCATSIVVQVGFFVLLGYGRLSARIRIPIERWVCQSVIIKGCNWLAELSLFCSGSIK